MHTLEQPSSFGALLRRYRTERGFAQEEVAERAGLSVHSISALERGLTQWPYRDTVARLARALELAPADERALTAAARRSARRRGATTAPDAGPLPAGSAAHTPPLARCNRWTRPHRAASGTTRKYRYLSEQPGDDGAVLAVARTRRH